MAAVKPSNNPGKRKVKVLPNFEPNKPWGAAKKSRPWNGRGVNWKRGSGWSKG